MASKISESTTSFLLFLAFFTVTVYAAAPLQLQNLCPVTSVGEFRSHVQVDFEYDLWLQSYFRQKFSVAFPFGIIIGNPQGNNLLFTSVSAVNQFLPQMTRPKRLTKSGINPTQENFGMLVGETLALTINSGLDTADPAFAPSPVNLGMLIVIAPNKCRGMTVDGVLSLSNNVLGGGELPPNMSMDDLVQCLVDVNINFRGGIVNRGSLAMTNLQASVFGVKC